MQHSIKLSDFDFYLPSYLIAQRPSSPRSHSSLLVYDAKKDTIIHTKFFNILKFLPSSSFLTFNNSKVIKARLFGEKKTGGKVEVFILKFLSSTNALCFVKSNSLKKIGELLFFPNDLKAQIIHSSHEEGTFVLQFNISLKSILETHGKIPIPPYIRGGIADEQDLKDYQTIYANGNQEGSVAAPTAGLHFDTSLLEDIDRCNDIRYGYVSLHVGIGTFRPIRSENIFNHQMHQEEFIVEPSFLSPFFKHVIKEKNYSIAVGTTSLRTLESLPELTDSNMSDFSKNGLRGETSLFITPGYTFKKIDGLITNFHLPKSSLFILVSALIGLKQTQRLYQEAIKKQYRFFSYGDAMLILT